MLLFFFFFFLVAGCQEQESPAIPTLAPLIYATPSASDTPYIPPATSPSTQESPVFTSTRLSTTVLTPTALPITDTASPVISLTSEAYLTAPPLVVTAVTAIVAWDNIASPPVIYPTATLTSMPTFTLLQPTEIFSRQYEIVSASSPVNIDFEGGQQVQGAAEVTVPQGWTAWWREGGIDCTLYNQLPLEGECPVDSYKRPEFTIISSEIPQYASRVNGTGQAARFFCTYGVCSGGYYQQVQVLPERQYVFSGWAFSWCSQNDAIAVSEIATQDGFLNCEVALGIDPTGGINSQSSAIIWESLYAYDRYTYIETSPVLASGDRITLFVRGRSLWGFKHNDFHFDELMLKEFK